MKNSKTWQLIRSMNKHEANSFEKYLRSPYFNSDTQLLPVFRELYLSISNTDSGISKQDVYRKATGSKKYDDKHFRYIASFLASHLENFFSLRELKNNPLLQLNLSMKAAADRDCEKSFNYFYRLFKNQAGSASHNMDFYYEHFKAYSGNLSYLSQKQKRKQVLRFDEVMDELDKFYISRKLQLSCEIINAQNVLSEEYSIRLLDETRNLLKQNHFEDEASIQVYHCILLTLAEPENENHAIRLQELIEMYAGKFPAGELRNIYLYLKNYCIKKLNLGRSEYMSRLFEIYKMMLRDDKMMRSDDLSQWEFKNIVSLALRLDELKWARRFMEKYLGYLPQSAQKNARVYNLANWHFHNREYNKTLKLLQDVAFTDLYYQLDTRAILLKLFFETDDDEAFFSQASSFRTFLSRNRLISTYQKKIYRNFINYSVKVLRAGENRNLLESLRDEAQAIKQIADLKWIEEKINERGG